MSLTMRCERTAMYRLKIFLVLMSIVQPGAFALSAQPPEQTRTLAWAPDGVRLATGDTAGVIRIWDTSTSSLLRTINAHEGSVYALAWRDDGTQLASSGSDNAIRIWNATDGSQFAARDHTEFPITSMTWHPISTQLLFGGGAIDRPNMVGVWDIVSDTIKYEGRVELGGLLVSPDRSHLIYLTSSGYAHVRPLADLSQFVVLGLPDDRQKLFQARTLTISQDSQTLAVGYINGWVRLWDIESRTIVAEYEVTQDHPTCCDSFDWHVQAIHLVGDKLTAVVTDGTMRAWDISTNQLITDVQIGEFFGGAFSPYGGRLAKLSRDAQLRITGVDILVPDPSLERLNGIAAACVPETAARDPFVADSLAEVGAFVERLGALPDDAIPPACRADLLAVAEALLAEDAGE